MMCKSVFFAVAILFFVFSGNLFACSVVFLSKDNIKVVGRNHDWKKRRGAIKFHKKDISKTAKLWGEAIPEGCVPAKWTSKHNSIVFISEEKNDFFMPIGGMNDTGLTVSELYVNVHESKDLAFNNVTKVLMGAKWVEYALDNYSSVNDVIQNIFDVRLINTFKCHWFLTDVTGANAVVEYVNGNLRIYYGQPLTIPVLTNTVYSISCTALFDYKLFGGKKDIPKGRTSIDRFIRAFHFLYNYKESKSPTSYVGKDIMERIAQPGTKESATQWINLYDLHNLIIYYRKAYDPTLYSINFKDYLDKPDKFLIDDILVKDRKEAQKSGIKSPNFKAG